LFRSADWKLGDSEGTHVIASYVSSLVADAATIWFDSPLKSTQPERQIEACVIERRESALNGDDELRMEREFKP
jgi:hypothetical protein